MQNILLITFCFIMSFGVQRSVLAAQFNLHYSANHNVNYPTLFKHTGIAKNTFETEHVLSNEAEEFSFIPSISLLGEMDTDNYLLQHNLSPNNPLQIAPLHSDLQAHAEVGIKSQWTIATDFVVSGFLTRRAYSTNRQIKHSNSAFETENTIISENNIIGSDISMHNLFNNKLIIGVNYQFNNLIAQQTDFPRQQINTYADYQVVNNLNVHLNWIISEKKALTPLLNTRKTTILTPIDTNTIHSHLLLLSVSYKM